MFVPVKAFYKWDYFNHINVECNSGIFTTCNRPNLPVEILSQHYWNVDRAHCCKVKLPSLHSQAV